MAGPGHDGLLMYVYMAGWTSSPETASTASIRRHGSLRRTFIASCSRQPEAGQRRLPGQV
ncbi:hypothetical protein L210DRAFT_936586 [Boletus edulis BED1]|uniref:Uncharacterized protein n=1 Tax=Boletus edulis BED1 TaxID=1328754 RepID=A0AAD4C2N7_BOLED|nr:hypothetical protein L210DRAFT_936586 [Boletus edulis BED1]